MKPPPTRQNSPVAGRVFRQRFSATPFGARLARHLALYQLYVWDIPYGSEASDTAALLVAELATNAVTHDRVPGRDFELSLGLTARTLTIEVSDARREWRPPQPGEPAEADGGRGLLLVEALADRWAVFDREPVGKTARAELCLRH